MNTFQLASILVREDIGPKGYESSQYHKTNELQTFWASEQQQCYELEHLPTYESQVLAKSQRTTKQVQYRS